MLTKSDAIVLSKIKYRDNDLIVKCYTNNRGIVSYILRGILNNKKSFTKVSYFQPLSQLQIEENYKSNHSLQTIKEVKLAYHYNSLHTNIFKGSIAMFLSEVLSSVLKEEEQNKTLYKYLETSLQWLDHQEEFSNFHLLFLLDLTKHLGFYPDDSEINLSFFNLVSGNFQRSKISVYSVTGENLNILKQLLGIKFDAVNTIKMNSTQRQSFLSMLLLYFELHLGDFKKPKSLKVFNQVFN